MLADTILVKTINDTIVDFENQTQQKFKIQKAGQVVSLFELLNNLHNENATTISLEDDNWDSGINNNGFVKVLNFLSHIKEVQNNQDRKSWERKNLNRNGDN